MLTVTTLALDPTDTSQTRTGRGRRATDAKNKFGHRRSTFRRNPGQFKLSNRHNWLAHREAETRATASGIARGARPIPESQTNNSRGWPVIPLGRRLFCTPDPVSKGTEYLRAVHVSLTWNCAYQPKSAMHTAAKHLDRVQHADLTPKCNTLAASHRQIERRWPSSWIWPSRETLPPPSTNCQP